MPEHLHTNRHTLPHPTPLSLYFSPFTVGPSLGVFDVRTVWTLETMYIVGNTPYAFVSE